MSTNIPPRSPMRRRGPAPIGGAPHSEGQPTKIVTPDQINDGWFSRHGMSEQRHDYLVIRKLPDGNYLVHDPAR